MTITGAGFVPGAQVTFGGAPGTVQGVSAIEITVHAPAHRAGTVPVIVINPSGAIGTTNPSFQYFPHAFAATAPAAPADAPAQHASGSSGTPGTILPQPTQH